MSRPQWLQDDLKIIGQWWSTRFLIISVLVSGATFAASLMASVWQFKDLFGRYGSLVTIVSGIAGMTSQFYRQKKLRVTEPEKAAAMVQPDVKP